MKNLCFLLAMACCMQLHAQNIAGFYTGVLHNDSARMIQKYELAIASYKGKVSGYSYVTFISNDTFYYGIREVKGYILGDSLIIEDGKFVSNNFPESPAKGVKRTITLPLNGQDSVISLNGSWKTNRTKRYYSVPGTIELSRSNDSANSSLINHLRELDIIESQKVNYVATSNDNDKSEKKKVTPKKDDDLANKNQQTVAAAPAILPYDQRKTGSVQTVEVKSDSVILAFYDNGVVDGDSISVYMNGTPIIVQAKLTTAATKQVIATPETGESQLLLVAENLGSIPPNTGLLTIRDGDQIYQLNFSADMQTNASIVIKRKKQ